MAELHATLVAAFTDRYSSLAARVRELVGPLSDEQFWSRPFAHGNSVGHLVLHLTGNLNYYLGAQVAGTGYVRDREREFAATERPAKREVMRGFDAAMAVVLATLRAQSAADWTAPYSAEREPGADDRFTIFLRCATHLHLHVGQLIYLIRELERQAAG